MATQFANASYQEIIDLHTEDSKLSVIGIHTPSTPTPQKMLSGFWSQFRKVKYNGCSLSLVPAAQLPADPSQVSYGAGDPPIDPRDLLNPILFKGCHGNDIGSILNTLYAGVPAGSSDNTYLNADSAFECFFGRTALGDQELIEALYYRALTDNTWSKAHPLRGFRKSGLHPMVYSLATNMQMNPISGGSTAPRDRVDSDNSGIPASPGVLTGTLGTTGTGGTASVVVASAPGPQVTQEGPDSTVLATLPHSRTGMSFFTPRLQRLGWLDTYQYVGRGNISVTLDGDSDEVELASLYASSRAPAFIPKVFMGVCILPPSYKTELYYRLVINHSFSFKGFRGVSMTDGNTDQMLNTQQYKNWNGDSIGSKFDGEDKDYV